MPSRRWGIDLSPEVTRWYGHLSPRDRAFADRALDRLAEGGPGLGMPHSRTLGDGLSELRFSCEGVSRRITYTVGPGRELTTLTTFRKQRALERHEVDRARRAMRTRSREQPMELGRSR